jgi:hypothetical protein
MINKKSIMLAAIVGIVSIMLTSSVTYSRFKPKIDALEIKIDSLLDVVLDNYDAVDSMESKLYQYDLTEMVKTYGAKEAWDMSKKKYGNYDEFLHNKRYGVKNEESLKLRRKDLIRSEKRYLKDDISDREKINIKSVIAKEIEEIDKELEMYD